ncbi:hypothetical protein HanIR_Chr04g0176611 [Helianthus annuus]|nr:hypothetical protein HanIR_Chr04g0176611 [Helianthus annuus]
MQTRSCHIYLNLLSFIKIPTYIKFQSLLYCQTYFLPYYLFFYITRIHKILTQNSKPYEMLHINLIGPVNLLPTNFIFDLTTKTHSGYVTTLKDFHSQTEFKPTFSYTYKIL